jgi:type I restriction enzyme R subunit
VLVIADIPSWRFNALSWLSVNTGQAHTTIDWNLRESTRAKMCVMVKRLLRTYGYPPDKTKQATRLVLAQAEAACAEWPA